MSVAPPPVVGGGSGELGSLPSVGSALDSGDLMMLPGEESPLPGGRAEGFEQGADAPWMQMPPGDYGGGAGLELDTSKRSSGAAGFRSREYDSAGSLGGLGDFVNGGSLDSGGMQQILGFDYQSAAATGGGAAGGGDQSMPAFQAPQIGGPSSGSMGGASPRSMPSVGSMAAITSGDMSTLFSGSDGPTLPTPPSRRQGVLDARPPGGSSDEEEAEFRGDFQGLDLGADLADLKPPGVGSSGAVGDDDDDKPHRCPMPGCGYAAKGSGHLKRHMRTHTGEKPFKCTWEGCTYASSQSTHLTAHMRKHTGERPFGCPVVGCDYSAARSWHVTRHMQRQHPDAVAAGLKATGKAGSPASVGTDGGGSGRGGAKAATSKAAPKKKESKGGGAGGKLSAMIKRKQVKTEPPPALGGFDLGQQLQIEPQAALHGQQDEQLPSYDDATGFGGGAAAHLAGMGLPPAGLAAAGQLPQHTVMGTILPVDGLEQDWAAAPPPSYDEVVGGSDLGGMSK